MKIVYYVNGKTMVGRKDARDLTEKELRKVIEQAASASGCLKDAQSDANLAKTKNDLIKVINTIVMAYGKFYETIKGGYDVVFNFE